MIADRMVHYCRAHNYDKDCEATVIRIFGVFKAHLQKSRARGDGSLFDVTEVRARRKRKLNLTYLAELLRSI